MNFNSFQKKYQKVPVEHFPDSISADIQISVLVQTYNHENYIKDCLDSIISQKTNFSIEILIGEDNSTDATRKICIEYARKFPEKIRLFLHKNENKIKVGDISTGNFNAFYNFYQARGKYIAFCEGDDYWTDPLKLQKQVDSLQKEDQFVLCYHRFKEKIEVKSSINHPYLDQPERNLKRKELIGVLYHPLLSTTCFRNFLKELPEEMIKVINLDSFLLSILGNLGKAKFQEDIQPTIYRRHSGGIWSDKERETRFQLKVLTFKNLYAHYARQKNYKARKLILSKLQGLLKMSIHYSIKTRNFERVNRGIWHYMILKIKEGFQQS